MLYEGIEELEHGCFGKELGTLYPFNPWVCLVEEVFLVLGDEELKEIFREIMEDFLNEKEKYSKLVIERLMFFVSEQVIEIDRELWELFKKFFLKVKKNPRLANVVVSVLAVGEVFDDFFLENWKKIVTDSLTKKKTEEIPFEIVNAFSGIAGVCSYYFKNFRAKDARELWALAENWFDCLLSKKEKKKMVSRRLRNLWMRFAVLSLE